MSIDDPNDVPRIEAPVPEPTRRRERRVRRAPILLVVVAFLVAAVIAQQNAPDDGGAQGAHGAAVVAGAGVGAGVPPSDVVSSAWYCAAGSSAPDGPTPETVILANLDRDSVEATITVLPGGDAAPVSSELRLAPNEELRVPVADVLATAEPGVVVEAVGGPIAVSHLIEHGDDFAVEPCTRSAARDWYFASGTTVDGARQDLVLFNPFGDDAIVDVSFVTDAGAQEPAALQALVIPRRARITIPVQDSVLRQAFVATHVRARAGRVVAEQVQLFEEVAVVEGGPIRTGVALSRGATSPQTVSRFAAGSTRDGGEATLWLANFTDTDARVDVRVVTADGESLEPDSVRVPSRGVATTSATTRVPRDAEYAVVVRARDRGGRRVPVAAELLASWSPDSPSTGIAGMVGTAVSATRWIVLRADDDAEAYVTVFNPGTEPVTAELLPANLVDRAVGATSAPELAIAPGAAKVVRLALLGARPVPAVITANGPIVAGLTLLGGAGASVSAAIPDLGHG